MENKNFNLTISAILDPTVTEAEVRPDGEFYKTTWVDICRALNAFGVKQINTAKLDAGGKNITLPVDALHAGVK